MNNESELSISYCVHSHVMFVRSSQTLLRVTQHSDKTIGAPMWLAWTWSGRGCRRRSGDWEKAVDVATLRHRAGCEDRRSGVEEQLTTTTKSSTLTPHHDRLEQASSAADNTTDCGKV